MFFEMFEQRRGRNKAAAAGRGSGRRSAMDAGNPDQEMVEAAEEPVAFIKVVIQTPGHNFCFKYGALAITTDFRRLS